MPRPSHQILTDYDDGCAGRRDIDMRAVMHEIIDDIRSSYKLALKGVVPDRVIEAIEQNMDDYVANHYGDD